MVYVQHVFKAHPEQVFLRYFWLFLWLHFGLEICKVIRVILPKTCKFNTHNSPIFLYKSMYYDLFRSDYNNQADPLLALSSRPIKLSRVDLPEPEGAIMERYSPSWILVHEQFDHRP